MAERVTGPAIGPAIGPGGRRMIAASTTTVAAIHSPKLHADDLRSRMYGLRLL
jgi:hypothetical protein